MNNKTAILIFANSAEKEAEKKSFLSVNIFNELNARVKEIAKQTNLCYFHFTENEQKGVSFGERFCNAIEAIFDKGFSNIITIGNDTPHLKIHHLLDTVRQLEENNFVLGPSFDGGFYLMGLKKEYFDKEKFLKFAWQTNQLKRNVVAFITSKNVNISFLPILLDLDSKKDLKSIIHSFKSLSNNIFNLLLSQLLFEINVIDTLFLVKKDCIISENFNKGSPLIFV